MLKEGNMGFRESVSLIIITLVTKIFYTGPAALVRQVGTAAWYATLISCLVSIIFFLFLCFLMNRFPGKDLIAIFDEVLGKVLGKIFSLIFSGFIIFNAGSSLREFLEILKAYTLPITQPSIILASFLLVVVLIAYVGLEGLGRISYASIFPIIGGMLFILLLAIPLYDADHLKPYLGHGIMKTLTVGVLRSSAYDDIVILAIIINSVHGLKKFKKIGLTSLILCGLTFAFYLLCYTMVYQYTVGSENVSGLFLLSELIYYSRFFQRIESIFLFIWTISSVITVGLLFYAGITVYCKAFKINNHKPLILPFAFLTFLIAILPKSLTETVEINMFFIRQYSLAIVYLMPLVVIAVAVIFKKKGGKVAGEKS